MNIQNILKSNLSLLVESGYGEFNYNTVTHDQLGELIFASEKYNEFNLYIFANGFKYRNLLTDEMIILLYSQVSLIKSELSIEKYSEASASGDFESFFPLIVEVGNIKHELLLPLVMYSGILNAISEVVSKQ